MVANKGPNRAAAKGPNKAASPAGIEVTGDGRLSTTATPAADTSRTNNGGKGPPSALEGGAGSPGKTAQSGDAGTDGAKGQSYGVQVHSDEEVGGLKKGVQIIYVTAVGGDEAGLKVREAHKANYGLSIRGVSPASDPDPNSMGGEREAAIMYANAENGGNIINSLGTEANAKAVKGLGQADVESLGE